MSKIEQAGLLGTLLYFHLKFVAGFQQRFLNAASNGAEPGNQHREGDENDEVRDVAAFNVKRVTRSP